MRKADSLRTWLTACIEDFAKQPERLQIFIESGQILARKSRTLSFVYQYTAKVLVTDFAGDADRLFIPVLAWIEKEQPELLQRQDSQPFGFEAELLDSDVSDVEISIDLTEPVLVMPRPDGSGYDTEHPPAPDFTNAFTGAEGVTFLQGFAHVEPVIASGDPGAVLTPGIPPTP
jgi:hypothetical protein